MRLLSVDIQGFKSFAKRVHVAFGPGITGVVGPNGSGKSNIAEAIRWVLGEQSVKALRAKERTDVIYSGSLGNASRAQVTLTFDNESGKFPIDTAEVAITRSLSKDGDSSYTVNGEEVRLVDLHHMLAQAGIGTKSYAVISQGTVDQYLTATPTGRQELFDEATGIKPLKITLSFSHQKLAKASSHAEEVRAVLAELTPKVAFLQRQVDKYNQRDTLMQQLHEHQRAWLHAAWHAAQQRLDRCQDEVRKAEAAIETTRAARKEAEDAKIRLIAVPTETQPKTPWAKQASSLLRTSLEFLMGIANGNPVNRHELMNLITSISTLLDLQQPSQRTRSAHSQEYEEAAAELERARQAEIASEREAAAASIALEQARQDALAVEQDILRECGSAALSEISSQPLQSSQEVDERILERLKEKIAAIGERDELVIREYEEAKGRAQQFSEQLYDIEATQKDIEKCIQDVTSQMEEMFARQFGRISESFQSLFTELFGGGKATLTHTMEGIDITVTPPRKRARHISLLSGGERALTSLALLLAIIHAQEPPFIVLDEVDAALDEANSKRFATLLKQYGRVTQSIVISHNRETMAAANALYGVTMHSDGVSTLYSVSMEDVPEFQLDAPRVAV